MQTRTGLRAIGVAALVVALTGCMKLDMDLTVSSDDKVDGTMIVGLARSLADVSGMSEEEMREELERDLELNDLPEGATAEPYQDDNFIGVRVQLEDVALDDLNEDSSGDDLRILHEDGKYTVSGAFDLSAEELGDAPLKELAEDDAEMRIRITLPGEVIEHNGELSGRTVTWHPEFGERNEILAVAEEDEGIPTLVWPLLGVAAFSVAMIFVIQTRRPRQTSSRGYPDAMPPGYDPGP